jgi:hypothetical protein
MRWNDLPFLFGSVLRDRGDALPPFPNFSCFITTPKRAVVNAMFLLGV